MATAGQEQMCEQKKKKKRRKRKKKRKVSKCIRCRVLVKMKLERFHKKRIQNRFVRNEVCIPFCDITWYDWLKVGVLKLCRIIKGHVQHGTRINDLFT